ncbi:MAG: hydrogenase iron-sulfur subunit [Candidatus Bathyarchaeota archaeon]|nr:MAG: hydrogenase iron-sulfur subunit [Candidatus Bathyarchaeota archaeon]
MFRPRIIGFVCNWALPKRIEIPSFPRMKIYPKMQVVQVMCVGRIDPVIVLDTFAKGADGVLLVGCPLPDCHFVKGNIQAENKTKILKKLLSLTGLEPERLQLEWAYATEIEPFSTIVDAFRNHIIKLGQSPLVGENSDEKILSNILAAKNAVADFSLRVLTGREEELTEAMNAYGKRIPQEEFDDLLDEIVNREFLRHKIHLLTSQKLLSVKEIATIVNHRPALILRQIADMTSKHMIALDHVEETTPLYKALEVK